LRNVEILVRTLLRISRAMLVAEVLFRAFNLRRSVGVAESGMNQVGRWTTPYFHETKETLMNGTHSKRSPILIGAAWVSGVLIVLFTGGTALAQSSDAGPGNPTVLDAIKQVQTSVDALRNQLTALQNEVNQLESPRRFYYLTKSTFAGDQPIGACAANYHFASLWEIFDTSNLQYDTSLGFTRTDSGKGPPQEAAWIRTGSDANSTSLTIGQANCSAWTSAGATANGTIISLPGSWAFSSDRIEPWATTTSPCSFPHRAWCIQD